MTMSTNGHPNMDGGRTQRPGLYSYEFYIQAHFYIFLIIFQEYQFNFHVPCVLEVMVRNVFNNSIPWGLSGNSDFSQWWREMVNPGAKGAKEMKQCYQ